MSAQRAIHGGAEATVVVATTGDGPEPPYLSNAVVEHGGAVCERSPAIVAVFDEPLRAVDAAAEIGLRGAPVDPRLSRVRVGAAYGECSDGQPGENVLGRALALSKAAAPGELWVGEQVHERVGQARQLEFAGTLTPAGGRSQIAAWRRTWPMVTGTMTQPPVPEGVRSAGRAWGLFGRRSELHRIEEGWRAAQAGRRGLVLVSGEAGIGKTRLVTEAARAAHGAGATVLYGHHDREVGIPHQGFGEALEQVAAHAPEDLLAEIRGDGAALAGISPGLGRRLGERPLSGSVDPGAAHVLFLAAANLFSGLTRRRPVLLVLEDIHAADHSSLLLLRHLLLGPFAMPMLVVGTLRPDELTGKSAAAVADLAARLSAPEVELEGLNADAIAGLTSQLASAAGPARELVAALWRDTGGNPLFATEVLRGLPDRGADRAGARLPIPRSVHEAVAGRIRALGEGVWELLVLAATIGREFDPVVLAAASPAPADAVEKALTEAERAGILEVTAGSRRFRFAHALMQRSLCESQSLAERGRAHRVVAEAYEALPEAARQAHAAELARHWLEARPEDRERTLAAAQRAGEQALDAFQPDAGVFFFTRALELIEGRQDDRRRCDLLIGLGICGRKTGNPEFRETLLEAARLAAAIGDSKRLVRATLANNRGLTSATGQVDPERVSLLERAIEELQPGDSSERARLLAALAQELSFSGDRARRTELAAEAVASARRLGDPGVLASVLVARFMPTWDPAVLDERLADTEECTRLADEVGDPLLQFHAVHWRSVALLQTGEVGEATLTIEREEALARRLGDAVARWLSSLDRGNLAAIAGNLNEAERLAERGLELGTESGQPDALAFYASQIAGIRWEQGRLPELLPLVEKMVETNPGIPAFRSLLALAQAEAGAMEEAARLLAAEAEDRFARLPMDLGWMAAMVSYAHACAEVGNAAAAAILYEQLAPFAGQLVYTGMSVWGDVEWPLGRLAATAGMRPEAERHLRASARNAERVGARLWQARAELSLASELPGGPFVGDRRLFAQVAEKAARAGAGALERRARVLAGEFAEASAAATGDLSGKGLTGRQLDVVRLVAQGKTNAEIGVALGISAATVKRHLETIYARLGVGTRAEAIAKLLR